MFSFKDIVEITNGKAIVFSKEYPLFHLLIDTRMMTSPASSIFFAIKSPRRDGHYFIEEAFQKGVRQFIVEKDNKVDIIKYTDSNFIEVNSSIDALQNLATRNRDKYTLPIIAITGSNGKTIVKEWLAQLLNSKFQIVKSPRSYNSQVGVPLSIWNINESHNLGIFEAGISLPGEMDKLEKIIQPTLGIFTNIGTAHDEGFHSLSQKTQEKLLLFENVQTLFYCLDHNQIKATVEDSVHTFNTFSWSQDDKRADIFVRKIKHHAGGCILDLLYLQNKFSINTSFSDEASIENLMHCISVLLYFKITPEEIQKYVSLLHPVAMRLELKEGINGSKIIDDAYNNDLAGLSIAINFLEHQSPKQKKTVILSDILESGIAEDILYKSISALLKEKRINKFIAIGPRLRANAHFFVNATFYNSTQQFIQQLSADDFFNETILVKGARVFEFEKVVAALQQRVHGTVLQINLDALVHNLNFYKSFLFPATKLMVMVKALAYGSGSLEVANLLQFHRIDYLGVAYADEGAELREGGITTPIMVMNPSPDSFAKIIEFHLEPEIYNFKILNSLIQYLHENNTVVKIHLKIDTGMKRLGFETKNIDILVSILQTNPKLQVATVFTHLAGADASVHNEFSQMQLQIFAKCADMIENGIGYAPWRHGLNSAGIIRFPEMQMDMVRLGIGLYGVESNNLKQNNLKNVGTLKTVISQIKKVEASETIGYSRNGRIQTDSEIATIAIGYADGYSRQFGNGKANVFVNGILCPTVGNICMDMTMIDVTGANAKEGQEVIVFGAPVTVSELAAIAGTIPYEILTGISERVKRIFYTE